MSDNQKFLDKVQAELTDRALHVLKLEGGAASGKTAAAFAMVSWAINHQNREVGYIDRDSATDPNWIRTFDIPVDDRERFLLIQPNTEERTIDYLRALVKGGATVVIDALHPAVGHPYTLIVTPRTVEEILEDPNPLTIEEVLKGG